MTRVALSALLIILLPGAFPADAFAQSAVCSTTRRGESATQAARRMTGHGGNAYQTWFQIMNDSSRFVPKSQYGRIQPGWRACVITRPIRHLSSNANHIAGTGAAKISSAPLASASKGFHPALESAHGSDGPQLAASGFRQSPHGVDLSVLWICVAMVVPWLGWRIVDDYLVRRKMASNAVRPFAQRFVEEFERPLVRYDVSERAVKTRLRHGAQLRRFDILLAPGEGRRYPNLSDHKKNVEYDVARVMHALADDSFVSGAPYTHAGWIVVPFEFSAPKQSGVTCISSL